MPSTLVLLRPAANRVYAREAGGLAAAELAVLTGVAQVEAVRLADVDYLRLSHPGPEPSAEQLMAIGLLSAFYAAFDERPDGTLRPLPVQRPDRLDDDLVSIPKYPGKTNEQFTRLLVNLTLAAATTPRGGRTLLDPLCGRGTTLSTAATLGLSAYGVEADVAAVEAYATFLRTYLRRKRLKHGVEVTPLRRDGRTLGRRLHAVIGEAKDPAATEIEVLTGDTRDSRTLWGKRRFDAIVTDAPYGVVHGAGRRADGARSRTRSAADLLLEAVPVWAGQLKPGGALGISWNTHHLSREDLSAALTGAELGVHRDGPWAQFGHRVDSSVHRDLLVAHRP